MQIKVKALGNWKNLLARLSHRATLGSWGIFLHCLELMAGTLVTSTLW